MTRTGLAALCLALAGTAGTARAGFQPLPIRLPAFRDTAAFPVPPAGTGADLLLSQWGYGGENRHYAYRRLFAPGGAPWALPTWDAAHPILGTAVGDFDGDGTTDVLWQRLAASIYQDPDLWFAWGADPLAPQELLAGLSEVAMGMMAFQALPPPAPSFLATIDPGVYTTSYQYQGDFKLRDLSAVGTTGVVPNDRPWVGVYLQIADDYGGSARILPARMGTQGRPAGLDDAFVPLHQGFRIYVNQTPAGATAMADVVLTPLAIGWGGGGDLPAFRAGPGVVVPDNSSCRGGGALDVNGDGLRDVVFVMALGTQGQLLWLERTATLSDLEATATVWQSLMARPGLPAFANPLLMRQVDLAAGPGIAVHDAGLDEILVVSGDGTAGFQVARMPAHGATVHELWAADVVGETGPDLLASVVTAEGAQEVWVYPDDGALSPTLAWNPEPPAVALLGADLTLSVDANDPDSPFTITWIRPPFPDATGTETLLVPGGELCTAEPVNVLVRALDDVGLFAELRETLPVAVRPSLVLVGADPPGRLVLAPGGVSGRAEGTAWPACGSAPAFVWDAPGVGMLLGMPGESGSSAWLDFTIPESTYEVLLSTTVPGEPALTLTATEGTLSGTATLPLELDARGLVDASASFDRASLAAGEVGFVRAQVASRLSVPLPGVRARVRLDGLDFAGEISVSGAPSSPGGQEGEVILDPLPAAPAVVELIVPVRSAGLPGGASVELFSASGVRLSPEADPPDGDEVVPGCGCGAGSGGGWAAAMLLLLARRRRPT